MPLKTKRWNDPVEPDDGTRILVCRYRPRGVRKQDETWDEWWPALGPSRELHAEYYGKHGPPIGWGEFRRKYLREMNAQRDLITTLGARLVQGETLTLLCSSACVDAGQCHRSVLAGLVLAAMKRAGYGQLS